MYESYLFSAEYALRSVVDVDVSVVFPDVAAVPKVLVVFGAVDGFSDYDPVVVVVDAYISWRYVVVLCFEVYRAEQQYEQYGESVFHGFGFP